MNHAYETITVDSVCRKLTGLNKEWITINEFETSHPKYDKTDDTSFAEYLYHMLNEREMIECLHTLSSCNCCEKHSCDSHELQEGELYLRECKCKCRQSRRHLYRGLYQYANTGTPRQEPLNEYENDEEGELQPQDPLYDYEYENDEEEETQPCSVDSESDEEERKCPIDQMEKYNKYIANLYRDDNMKLDNQIVTAEQIDYEGDEDILPHLIGSSDEESKYSDDSMPHLLDATYEESDEEEQKMQRDQIEKYDKYIANLYHEENMKLSNQIVTTEQIDNEDSDDSLPHLIGSSDEESKDSDDSLPHLLDAPYEESEDSDDSIPPLIDASYEDSDEYPLRMMIL